jgi:hypothetical protein
MIGDVKPSAPVIQSRTWGARCIKRPLLIGLPRILISESTAGPWKIRSAKFYANPSPAEVLLTLSGARCFIVATFPSFLFHHMANIRYILNRVFGSEIACPYGRFGRCGWMSTSLYKCRRNHGTVEAEIMEGLHLINVQSSS